MELPFFFPLSHPVILFHYIPLRSEVVVPYDEADAILGGSFVSE
jgi:hypothetical protein